MTDSGADPNFAAHDDIELAAAGLDFDYDEEAGRARWRRYLRACLWAIVAAAVLAACLVRSIDEPPTEEEVLLKKEDI